MRIFLLALFGAAGTLARYGMQGLIYERSRGAFPFGTLLVNFCGCLLLGAIGEFSLSRLSVPPDWRVGITVGFFGAFTTFSSFSWETVRMLEGGEWMAAGLYVGASVTGCLLLTAAGIRLGRL